MTCLLMDAQDAAMPWTPMVRGIGLRRLAKIAGLAE